MDLAEFDRVAARVGDPLLIPGIYNFCDYRCQRCPFTARCLNFQTRSEMEPDAATYAAAEIIKSSFRDGIDHVDEWPEYAVDDVGREAAMITEWETMHEQTVSDPLISAAREYTDAAQPIAQTLAQNAAARNARGAQAALVTIAWMSQLIPAKMYRAVCGDYSPYQDAQDTQRDANGSAKLVRVMIAASQAAWRALMSDGRTAADGIPARMISMLSVIDAEVSLRFPFAMAFVRPGFDDDRRDALQ